MKETKVEDPKEKWYLLIVISCSLLFFVVVSLFISNVQYVGGAEDAEHANLAQNLAAGKGFVSDGIALYFRPYAAVSHPGDAAAPLTPLLIALLFKIFGISAFVAKLPSLFAGLVALPILVFILGKKLYTPFVGFVSALITLFSPINFPTTVHAEAELLFAVFSLAACLFFIKGFENPRSFLLMGVALGIAYLTKYTTILTIFGIVLAYGIISYRTRKRSHSHFALGMMLTLVIMLPWLIRNYLLFGDPLYAVGRHVAAFFGLLPDTRFPINGMSPTFIYAVSALGLQGLLKKFFAQAVRAIFAPELILYVLGIMGAYYSEYRAKILLPAQFFTFFAFHTIYWIYFPNYFIFVNALLVCSTVHLIHTILPERITRSRENQIRKFAHIFLFTLILFFFFFALSKFFVSLTFQGTLTQEASYPFRDSEGTISIMENTNWVRVHLNPGEPVFVARGPWGFAFHSQHPTLVIPEEGFSRLLGLAREYGVNYTQCDIPNVPLPHQELEVVSTIRGMSFCKILWEQVNPEQIN